MTSFSATHQQLGSTQGPDQPCFRGDFSAITDLEKAVALMKEGVPLAIDNDAVWGIWGDACNESFVETVLRIKNRPPDRTFGLTAPFETVLPMVDMGRLHPDARPLFADSSGLLIKELLGAIVFVRFPGDYAKIKESGLPATVVSYEDQTNLPVLQTYDPVGKNNLHKLLELARKAGIIYPCASSLNCSGQKEIIDHDEALKFVERFDCDVAVMTDSAALHHCRGSYTIIEFNTIGIQVVRQGNIGKDIIERILSGYGPVYEAEQCKPAAYPECTLHLADLPPEEQGEHGTGMARAIRTYLGWSKS